MKSNDPPKTEVVKTAQGSFPTLCTTLLQSPLAAISDLWETSGNAGVAQWQRTGFVSYAEGFSELLENTRNTAPGAGFLALYPSPAFPIIPPVPPEFYYAIPYTQFRRSWGQLGFIVITTH